MHKISLQSAKMSHAYPIIRLPREFRRLAGAVATIYETTHNSALAFVVVPRRKCKRNRSSALNKEVTSNRSLDMAEIAGPNPAESIYSGSFFIAVVHKNLIF